MGLAASQSKLLSLTTRLSRLEYQAQKLSNDKLRMSMESDAISAKYLKALSQKKLTVENGDGNYVTATANKLMDYNALGDAGTGTQRILKDNSGRVIVSNETAQAFKTAKKNSASLANQYGSQGAYLKSVITPTSYSSSTTVNTSTSTYNDGRINSSDYYNPDTGIDWDTNFLTFDVGNCKAISLQTTAEAKKLESTDPDEIATAVANATTYGQLIDAQDQIQHYNGNPDTDYPYANFWQFMQAYQNGKMSSDSDEDLAKRFKYFEQLIYQARTDTMNNSEDERYKLINKAVAKALSANSETLATIPLTDAEKASATYLKKTVADTKFGIGYDKNATENAYAKIKAYQEAWRDATEHNNAVVTTTSSDNTGETITTTSYTFKDKDTITKTTTSSVTTKTPVYDETKQAYYANVYNGNETFLNQLGYTTDSTNSDKSLKYDATAASWYEEIFQEMEDCGYVAASDEQLNDADWLYNKLNIGAVYITEKTKDTDGDGKKDWNEIAWATGDNAIEVEDDDSTQAIAKAEYDREINNNKEKEQKLDVQLKNIDTEHSSVKNEVESTQKVIDKNIERNYKIFNA